ncbi:BTAD domain-containing putative transcriptional regulator [Kutzneria viridogrisea]
MPRSQVVNVGVGVPVPIRVEILGPVRVLLDGDELPLGPPLQRAVVALLALRPNRAASRAELVDAIWGEDPPATAQGSLSTYLSALRRVLEPDRPSRAPGSVLVSAGSGAGYLLRLPEDAVDLHRAEAHRERARQAHDAGGFDLAAERWREALALWRGQPFDGISCPFVVGERTRIDELRLATTESLSESLSAAERFDDAVAELDPIVRRQPLRERPRALLMTALYRSGRKAEALELYEEGRRVTVEQLGIEPGPQLRTLHASMVSDAPSAAPPSVRPRTPVPAQLPHDVPGFTGRERELAALTELLAATDRPVAVISAIDGSGGIGKTALAVHAAHRIAERFPDGQLYVNLRGFDPRQPPLQPASALGQLLRGLGVDAATIPGEADELAALYRSQLAGKRMLVLLDNAASTDQVRPLLPGSPTCSVLVTSRNRLGGLVARDGAHRITLDVLSPAESVCMLAGLVGDAQVRAQREAAAELAALCGHLPLALRVAAAQLTDRPHLTLADLREELADERARLDVLAVDDETTAVRAVLSWSYHALKPDAAQLFRQLGLHAGGEFSAPVAAALAGAPLARTRRLLDVLAAGHLIEEVGRDRYRLHDLLKVYSAEVAVEHDGDQARAESATRMLQYYLHSADAVDRVLAPFRRRPQLPEVPADCVPERFDNPGAALAWGELELANLVAAVEQAAQLGDTFHATRIPGAMWAFLAIRTPWVEWMSSHRTGIAAASAGGDHYGEATLLISLGFAYQELHRPQQALDCLLRAKSAHDQLPDRPAEDVMLGALGAAYFGMGRIEEALDHTTRALAGYRARGDRWGEGMALCNLGGYARERGNHEQAVANYERALELFEQLTDQASQLKAYRELGRAHVRFHHYDAAADCFRRAAGLFRRFGGRAGEGWSLHELADALHNGGHLAQAREQWRAALKILDEVDDPRADQVRERLAATLA